MNGWLVDGAEMLYRYVRQELVDPLRNAFRWVGFGILGGLFILLGSVFIALGVLRLLQSPRLPFVGGWSWAPYLIVSFVGLLTVFVVFSRSSRGNLD